MRHYLNRGFRHSTALVLTLDTANISMLDIFVGLKYGDRLGVCQPCSQTGWHEGKNNFGAKAVPISLISDTKFKDTFRANSPFWIRAKSPPWIRAKSPPWIRAK